MLGRLVNEVLKERSAEYPWGNTLPIFQKADLRICNLECVISDRGRPWSATPKVFHFRSDAKNVAVLKVANIDMVSLANNHALDFEYDALFEMLEILDKTKISYAGAGVNLEAAMKPAIKEVREKKIGFVAFTDNEPDWSAKDDFPGLFYVPIDSKAQEAKRLFKFIENIKTKVDFLIVSAHWGPNWGYEPPREHVPFAHTLIERGADIVFGHSGHVFRGIEFYKAKPIIYCAGDFIDDYAVDEIERNDQSFIFVVEVGERVPNLHLYPTVIRDFQARLAQGAEQKEIVEKMRKLSHKFGTKAIWNPKEQSLHLYV